MSKEKQVAMDLAEELAEVKGRLEQLQVRHERLIDEYSVLYAEHTMVWLGSGEEEEILPVTDS